MVSATSPSEVLRGLRHIDWRCGAVSGYVVKSPSRFGGQNMGRASNHEEVQALFLKYAPDSGYVLIEPFLNQEGKLVDKRVFVANGNIIGMVDRVAADGEWQCNIHAGASTRRSKYIPEKACIIAKQLSDKGVFCAGLDFLGDELTEINVSCPSAIPQINKTSDCRSELLLIAEGWRWKNK